MKLVLLGAPGAGKGTQASFLKNKYNLAHISTGDIFRANLKNNTPLGIEAKKFMDNGQLVPDNIVMNMVGNEIENLNNNNGFMLDGFPRTIPQAEFLEKIVKLDAVILFHVPDEEIIRRLTSRRMCKNCGSITDNNHDKCPSCGGELFTRDDDREDVIKSRLKVFHEQTEQLIEFYRKKNLLIEINASGSPEEIFARVVGFLDHDKN